MTTEDMTEVGCQPRITVLMATHNGASYIGEQLATIRSQVGVKAHLVVHDDSSTDGTIEKVNQFGARYPDFSYSIAVNVPGTGAAALNFFTLIASADVGSAQFVAFSDQDDVWLPNKLKRGVEVMMTEGTDAYASNLVAWDVRESKYWTILKSSPQMMYDYLFQSASAGCTYVLSRKTFDLVKDYINNSLFSPPRSCSHDYFIYALTRAKGMTWSIDKEAHILYRQHDHNVFGAMPGICGILHRIKLIRSGWYLSTVSWTIGNIENNQFTSEVKLRLGRLKIPDRWWLMTRVSQFRRKRLHRFALIMILLLSSKP
jgi:rhamnosyltransferase